MFGVGLLGLFLLLVRPRADQQPKLYGFQYICKKKEHGHR